MAAFYCDLAKNHLLHGWHHDHEHGRLPADDAGLLERLALEINQAGLSWLVVLRKRQGLARAFHGFDLARVAAMGESDVLRLLADPGVIRHRGKIEAVLRNARRMLDLAGRHGSVRSWLDHHHPMTTTAWLKVLRREFVFVGPEIAREFLTGVGYLPGAHRPDCPVYANVLAERPRWLLAPGRVAVEQGTIGGEGWIDG